MNLNKLKEECKVEMFISSDEGLKLVEIIEQKQNEIEHLQERHENCKNQYSKLYEENKRFRDALEYVNKAIYTQHATMIHMDNTDFEKGQIRGLVIASNIVKKAVNSL